MASLPQYPQRVASAAILLVLLLRFSPHVAAQVDPPVPGPTPLQCPPGENPTDLGGGVTQCCSYLQTCHLTPPGSVPNSSGQFLNFTATCCPTGSFCLRDYSPFAACVAPPPDQCTACPVSTNAFGPPSINSCYFAFAAGRFCCSLQVCSGGVGASTGQTCCDQGNKTQCTRPLQGIASPTADSAGICCEPGQVLCNDRCCNAANCVPAPGASAAFGPYTCNTPGEVLAKEEPEGEFAPCIAV